MQATSRYTRVFVLKYKHMPVVFNKKTIKDVPLEHSTVLMRADYNVPIAADGSVADDFRIAQTVPTLRFLQRAGCKIVIIAHLGRPGGKRDAKLSLEPVAIKLGELLGQPVAFVPDCIGDRVSVAVKHAKPGQVILLENLRFHKGEESNDMAFAEQLAKSSGAKYFVQDGFGVAYRKHASVEAITHVLPSVAGLLLKKEITTITHAMHNPKTPLVAVVGGTKVSDKILAIEQLVHVADHIIIGGALANTFFKYLGYEIGKSVYEPGQDALIERIYAEARRKVGDRIDDVIVLPTDVAVAPSLEGSHKRTIVDVRKVQSDDYILDLGITSTELMLAYVRKAATVVWCGTLGRAEDVMFAYASAKLATALAEQKDRTVSVVGGGDTTDFVLHWHHASSKDFGLISTGGGASLEVMAGRVLPGVVALM